VSGAPQSCCQPVTLPLLGFRLGVQGAAGTCASVRPQHTVVVSDAALCHLVMVQSRLHGISVTANGTSQVLGVFSCLPGCLEWRRLLGPLCYLTAGSITGSVAVAAAVFLGCSNSAAWCLQLLLRLLCCANSLLLYEQQHQSVHGHQGRIHCWQHVQIAAIQHTH